MKYLYSCKKTQEMKNEVCIEKIRIFTPKFWKPLLPGEDWNIRKVAVRMMFQLITKGKAKIYYVMDGTKIVHTSYVVPSCVKFPFLKKDDYEIGPCYTFPEYRGRGIYPIVLQAIHNSIGNKNTVFYMIVEQSNSASIKGIEKAGFGRCGNIEVTKITKCYRKKDMV